MIIPMYAKTPVNLEIMNSKCIREYLRECMSTLQNFILCLISKMFLESKF